MRFDMSAGDNDKFFFRWSPNRHTQRRTLNGILDGPGENGFNPFFERTITSSSIGSTPQSDNGLESQGQLLALRRRLRAATATSTSTRRASVSPQALASQLAVGDFFGLWAFSNYGQLGSTVSYEYNNTYGLLGSVSKVWRTHNLKTGIDTRRLEYLTRALGNALCRFRSNSGFTREVWDNAASEVNSGDSFASFLLGAPAGGAADFNVRPYLPRLVSRAVYFRTTGRATPRLTLTSACAGTSIRRPTKNTIALCAAFDLTAPSPIAGKSTAESLAQYPNLRNLTGRSPLCWRERSG